MRGSEKQIRWAEEIKVNVLAVISEAITACESSNISDAQKAAFVSQMNTLKFNVENVEYAGDLIEVFRDVEPTGDYKHDISVLKSALRGDVNKTFSKPVK